MITPSTQRFCWSKPAEEHTMNAFTQARTVARRDSATKLLSKLGLKPRDYDLFIEKLAANEFLVKLDAAKAHLASLAATAKTGRKVRGAASAVGPDIDETAQLAAAKPAKAAKAPRATTRTVTSVALELIRAGKTNAEVFDALNAEFAIGDAKRSYPAWYRRHLKIRFSEDYSATAGTSTKAAAPKTAKPAKVAKAAVAKAASTSKAALVSAAAADPFRKLD
jgi:hypothetical protein